MTNKKLLTFAAIAIGGYIVWKKFIKEDEPTTAPAKGEEMNNVGGNPNEYAGEAYGVKYCWDSTGTKVIPCPKKSISKPRLATARKQTFGSDFNIR